MKKVFLSLTFLLVAACGLFAQGNGNSNKTITSSEGPVFKFEETTVDYGDITQGSDPVRYFKFTNVGGKPLVISNAKGSCGCTVPTWPKGPISPGESAEIKVHYDTKRLGPINKSVTVISNASEHQKVLRIKGMISAPKTDPTKSTSKGAPVNGK